jgi:hypothetical protein
MNLCFRAYLLLRREKKSGASSSRCFKDQRENWRTIAEGTASAITTFVMQSVNFGNDPPAGRCPDGFI